MKLKVDSHRNTLIEQVTSLLEHSIITGKVLPGEKWSEAKLAEKLGVSKAPVREALIRLEELGLVRKNHRGREVVRFSLDELLDLLEVKELIELHAASKGSEINDPQVINKLNKLVCKMDELLTPLDYPRLRETYNQFHDLLVESSRNKKLYEIYINIVKQVRWATHISLERPGRLEFSNKEHREIFNAFAASDKQKLCNLLDEHSRNLRDQFVKAKSAFDDK